MCEVVRYKLLGTLKCRVEEVDHAFHVEFWTQDVEENVLTIVFAEFLSFFGDFVEHRERATCVVEALDHLTLLTL